MGVVLSVKEGRRTDEAARKGGQSSERTNVRASADCTGENDGVIDEGTATFSALFSTQTFFLLYQILVKFCWRQMQIRQTATPTTCCG